METKASPLGTDFMPYAGGTGEGPSQAEGPSPEGPLAIWHKPQLASEVGLNRYLTASRGPDASAETCEKVLRTFSVCSGTSQTAIKTRIYTSRRREVSHEHAPSRTFSDSKMTCRPNDESENRPGGSNFVLAQPEQVFDRIVREAKYF